MMVPAVKFPILLLCVRSLGLLIAILILIWNVHYRGGLALFSDNKSLLFNLVLWIGIIQINPFVITIIGFHLWLDAKLPSSQGSHWKQPLYFYWVEVHPVLMVIGLLLLNGEAMLAYKTASGTKGFKKLLHLTLQFLALVLGVIGLWAAWKFHNDRGIDNFYSLHSWLGLACLFLFAIQWVAGFATFWYPGGSAKNRASLMQWHVLFGVYIYVLSLASCITGVLEKVTFLQTHHIISHYSAEAILVNILGVMIVLLGGFVIFAVISPSNGKRDVIRGSIELVEEQPMVCYDVGTTN